MWNQVKIDRAKETGSTCNLRQYTILAWNNPDTLNSYSIVDSSCIYYRDALIHGGQEMVQVWIYLNAIMKSRNGDPEKVQRNFEERFKSKNNLNYTRLYIMSFGWWNYANQLIPHLEAIEKFGPEFKKLLLSKM